MKVWEAACLHLLVAACTQQASERIAPDSAVSKAPDAITAPTAPVELVGEWRVAGVGGKPIDLPHAISATITASRIKVSSQCVAMEWSYRIQGQRLVTEPRPIVSCDRGRYPEERAVESVLDAAKTASRTEENGIEIAGGGGKLLLFSQ